MSPWIPSALTSVVHCGNIARRATREASNEAIRHSNQRNLVSRRSMTNTATQHLTAEPNGRHTTVKGKKVAVFLPNLLGGGAQRTILNLAHGIADQGYSVDLVLARATGPYLSEVRDTLRLVDLKAGRTVTSILKLARYVRQQRPDAVLSALARANIAAVLARRIARVPTKIVVSERNTLSSWAQRSHKLSNRITVPLVRHFYPWADGITAVSQGVADDLSHLASLPSKRIHVIYNPVVTPLLRQKLQAPLEHPWFQPGKPPVLLAVGSLSRQKDFPTLINAFAQLRQTGSARLLILGEGSQRPHLEALIRNHGLEDDVLLPGWVDNPYPYFVRATAFVLSSRWEGLPGVLIEALYAGIPVVATDCPSGPREILNHGQLGSLVPVGDATQLAQAMKSVLRGDGPHSPPDTWEQYELEHVVQRYLELLFA